jgi:UDP-N-acetylglucosamine 3-dehydrogenase
VLKVLLLGVGRWGANHLRVARQLPVELFVADPAESGRTAARKAGVPADHLSPDPLIFKSAIDAAVIATPAQSHLYLCRQFLEAGKDIFVEKPITLRSSEALELARLAAQRRLILQVGHIFRFDNASQWLRQAVAEGQFGQVRLLRGIFSGFKRPRTDTGVMFADAIHFVDLFNFILDRSPHRVLAVARDFFARGMEDEALVLLDYAGGTTDVLARVEAGYHLPGKFREVIIVGDRLSAICDYNVAQYKIRTFENVHLVKDGKLNAVEGATHQLEFSPEEPLLAEWHAFIDSVTSRQPPLADGQAGYESVRIIEAALESVRTGHAIELQSV